jgi:hypothetical protein
MISIATGMKNLHADLALLPVDRLGDQTMTGNFPPASELSRERRCPASPVWCNPAGDDQSDTPSRSLSEKGRQSRVVTRLILKTRMH